MIDDGLTSFDAYQEGTDASVCPGIEICIGFFTHFLGLASALTSLLATINSSWDRSTSMFMSEVALRHTSAGWLWIY